MIFAKSPDMTIKQKLTAIIMLISIMAIVLALSAFIIWNYFDIKKGLVANLTTHAAIVADNSRAAVDFNDSKQAQETLKALRAAPSILYARICNSEGGIIANYSRDPNDKSIHILYLKEGEDYNFANNTLNLRRDIIVDDSRAGTLYLQASLNEIKQGVIRTGTIGAIIAAIVIFVTYLAASKLQRIISGPILHLAEVAKNVSENKDYTARAIKHTNDEIGRLIEAFNEMLFEIQQRDTELRDINEKLEIRVKERTADIVIVNRRLEDLNAELKNTVNQLTTANRELADFAHVAAHDLKAPLRAIGSLAGIIHEDYGHKLDDEGKNYLNTMIRRTERMSELINGILRYSEIGRISSEKEEVDINKLIKEIIKELNPPDNIEIKIENELPKIYCEKIPISQIFQNLLSNAIKYTDKPVCHITISSVEQKGCWQFSLKDNGIGIEEKYFDKVFVMFQTLARRDEFESTGIGLAMVKKTVELYGGTVWVESTPGQGSTFHFTMPKQKSNKEPKKYAKFKANTIS